MAYELISLQELATFQSVKEMDNTVRQYNTKISKTHYETLNLLKQYSCKVIGVSHIKIKTIAKRLKKSTRTIARHLKYLKEKGFISIINTTRLKRGGDGANAYLINPIEVQQKIINVIPQMSYRKTDRKHNQYQSQQAMAYVQTKKETMSILKLLKSFISNNFRKKQLRLKRIENIKYFRSCPDGVPKMLYNQYKYCFSDSQIKILFNIIEKEINQFSNIDNIQHTNIIENTLDSLVKALKRQYKNKDSLIHNIFAYTSGIAKKQAFRQSHFNQWSKFWGNEQVSVSEKSTFKQISMDAWAQAGVLDEDGIPY
ncbi:replication/maintenance protein RepL [Staphylococcus simulans]|uniref:replication/maintenance protein RepL n=1 Tax=Staphylococcus simulans TaxID=1286 RepID=UPI001A8F2EAE|nr:replication/maintenance protein RepL [Staphylococcus simulans]MBO0386164.1 replication/maintenance protein RepL [Staphylococcus simulans]